MSFGLFLLLPVGVIIVIAGRCDSLLVAVFPPFPLLVKLYNFGTTRQKEGVEGRGMFEKCHGLIMGCI